jgi:hypothetical protein
VRSRAFPMADLSFLDVHLDALGRLAVAVLVLIALALFVQYRFSATGYVQMLSMTSFQANRAIGHKPHLFYHSRHRPAEPHGEVPHQRFRRSIESSSVLIGTALPHKGVSSVAPPDARSINIFIYIHGAELPGRRHGRDRARDPRPGKGSHRPRA